MSESDFPTGVNSGIPLAKAKTPKIATQFVSTVMDFRNNTLVELNGQGKKKRARLTVSCLKCKAKKIKCDRVRPVCGSCSKHFYPECKYQAHSEEYKAPKRRRREVSDSSDTTMGGRSSRGGASETANNSSATSSGHVTPVIAESFRFSTQEPLLSVEEEQSLPQIMKGLPLLRTMKVRPVNKTTTPAHKDVSHFFGTTVVGDFLDADPRMAVLLKNIPCKVKEDARKWHALFSTEIYANALERKISVEGVQLIGSCIEGDGDFKLMRFNCICNHLERYLIDYKTFMEYLTLSVLIISGIAPVLTEEIISTIAMRHFVPNEMGKLLIVNKDTINDVVEITCVLSILRLALNKDKSLSKVPHHLNFNTFLDKESIKTDIETDILHAMIKIIVTDFRLDNYPSLLTLALFVCSYLVKAADRTNPFSSPANINFGVIVVRMALSLGLLDLREANISKICQDCEEYLKVLSQDDLKNIKAVVVAIDTINSFASGMTQMISPDREKVTETAFIKPEIVKLIHFYRNAYRLVNTESLATLSKEHLSMFSIVKTGTGSVYYGLKEYEALVQNYEAFASQSIKVLGAMVVERLQFLRIGTMTRVSALLCHFYANSYRVISAMVSELEENPTRDFMVLEELRILEARAFRRCLRQSILKLVMLNILLTNVFNRPEYYATQNSSTQLIQMFSRTMVTLAITIMRLIYEHRNNTKFYKSFLALCASSDFQENFSALDIFGLRFEILDDIRAYGCKISDAKADFFDEVKKASHQLDQIIMSPRLVIETVLGFYFNCSQSLVSQSFEFILCYKYLVLVLKSFEESGVRDINEFDFNSWIANMEAVNVTWFAKC